MTTITIDRAVVEQALEALETPIHEQSFMQKQNAITNLRTALAEPVQEPHGCDHCNHPLYAAIKCRVCGRVTEPTPPQRKPLAEWQINDLMADIDPEDRDSWSFRQGVYAAEKHHGVRK